MREELLNNHTGIVALDTELVPLAVWDGAAGGGAGGTSSTVGSWRRLGYEVEVIDLREIARPWTAVPTSRPAPVEPDPHEPVPPDNEPRVRTMAVLFADVVHFSAMSDLEIPLFVEHFLGEVANLARHSPHAPLVGNTWGDGLYFVFEKVRDAGMFALALCELVSGMDWAARGLPPNLNLRLGLHAGPLFACTDPVTGLPNYTGKHVVPAARIEPITPPGLVYATEEFAALAAADRVPEFTCDPVGRLGLAKGAGTASIYRITPRTGQKQRSWGMGP